MSSVRHLPSDVRAATDAPRWHERADVVVVGLGAAGASAARGRPHGEGGHKVTNEWIP